jgi:hypothetical protein
MRLTGRDHLLRHACRLEQVVFCACCYITGDQFFCNTPAKQNCHPCQQVAPRYIVLVGARPLLGDTQCLAVRNDGDLVYLVGIRCHPGNQRMSTLVIGNHAAGFLIQYQRPDIAENELVQCSLHMVISDNGPGFPEDLLDSDIQAFVTYRAEGTGLGLFMVQGFARSLEIESSLRIRFRMEPVSHWTCLAAGAEMPETLLIIEDEQLLGTELARHFRGAAWEVVWCN